MAAGSQHTLADLFTQYQLDYLSDKAPSTQYGSRQFLARVLRDLGPLPLEEVTPDVLRAWKQRLSLRHKPGMVHKYGAQVYGASGLCAPGGGRGL